MREGKELILATKPFAKEIPLKSWYYTLSTFVLIIASFSAGMMIDNVWFRAGNGMIGGLLMSRMFVIYHDNQHGAILHHSTIGNGLFALFGLFALAPVSIWKRSHDHHHVHNSKLSNAGIGAYPTISKEMFQKLSKGERRVYLTARHPVTIFLGYLSIFIFTLNVHSFLNSVKRHFDCGVALLLHTLASVGIFYFLGWQAYLFAWLLPFLTMHGIGSYLFYIQHNFPGVEYKDSSDWTYHEAALRSTSFLDTWPIMHWFTGNIAYHHIHHLNVRIPFYRLPEVMAAIPELQNPKKVRLFKDMAASFRLKVWDNEKGTMVGLDGI